MRQLSSTIKLDLENKIPSYNLGTMEKRSGLLSAHPVANMPNSMKNLNSIMFSHKLGLMSN